MKTGEKWDSLIALVIILAIALNYWGIAFNAAAVIANDNVMPVVTDNPFLRVTTDYGTERRLTSEGNLLWLADRINIDFPVIEDKIPKGFVGSMFRSWVKYLDYPIEGGLNIVSVGDIMRWVGTCFFLLLNPIMIVVLIPLRGYRNVKSNGSWRGKTT